MNLKIKRIYNLGNYSNVEFTEELNGIPEKLLFNKEVMDKFRRLMMLNVERAYKQYVNLMEMSDEEKADEHEVLVDELDQLDKENN